MPIDNTLSAFFLGGIIGVFIAMGILILLLITIGLYIYFAIAWRDIAKKLKYKRPWLSWIPIANLAMILQLGGFHWAWVFLSLIPFAGWIALMVMLIIANWRVFESRKYPGWYSISLIIPQVGLILYMVAIGFVAWADKKKR